MAEGGSEPVTYLFIFMETFQIYMKSSQNITTNCHVQFTQLPGRSPQANSVSFIPLPTYPTLEQTQT